MTGGSPSSSSSLSCLERFPLSAVRRLFSARHFSSICIIAPPSKVAIWAEDGGANGTIPSGGARSLRGLIWGGRSPRPGVPNRSFSWPSSASSSLPTPKVWLRSKTSCRSLPENVHVRSFDFVPVSQVVCLPEIVRIRSFMFDRLILFQCLRQFGCLRLFLLDHLILFRFPFRHGLP